MEKKDNETVLKIEAKSINSDCIQIEASASGNGRDIMRIMTAVVYKFIKDFCNNSEENFAINELVSDFSKALNSLIKPGDSRAA